MMSFICCYFNVLYYTSFLADAQVINVKERIKDYQKRIDVLYLNILMFEKSLQSVTSGMKLERKWEMNSCYAIGYFKCCFEFNLNFRVTLHWLLLFYLK
jgi:hypothetical protein